MTKHNLYTRTENVSQVGFDNEELELLKSGQNYTIEKSRNSYIYRLIIETENEIGH